MTPSSLFVIASRIPDFRHGFHYCVVYNSVRFFWSCNASISVAVYDLIAYVWEDISDISSMQIFRALAEYARNITFVCTTPSRRASHIQRNKSAEIQKF